MRSRRKERDQGKKDSEKLKDKDEILASDIDKGVEIGGIKKKDKNANFFYNFPDKNPAFHHIKARLCMLSLHLFKHFYKHVKHFTVAMIK